MTKHNMFQTEYPPRPQKMPIHPVWRGIGLILAVILPLGSYIVASLLISNKDKYSWLIIPEDIILYKNPQDPYLLVRLLYTLIIIILIGGLLTLITFLIAKIFGPSRYDPLDVPLDQVAKRKQ